MSDHVAGALPGAKDGVRVELEKFMQIALKNFRLGEEPDELVDLFADAVELDSRHGYYAEWRGIATPPYVHD